MNQSAGSEFFLEHIRGAVKGIVIVAETITLDQSCFRELDLESVTLIGKNIKFSSDVFQAYFSYPEIHMYGMTESDNYTIVERNGIQCSGGLLFANGTIVLDERAIEASLIGQWEFAGVIRHNYDNEYLTLSGLIANKESGIWFGELYEEETLSYLAEHTYN